MNRIIKRVLGGIAQGILGLAVIAFFLLMFLEFVAGCGEHYVDSKGNVHTNQCFFINR